MQKFISKYVLTAHLALLAVAPLFLFPFFGANTVSTVSLWMSLLCAIWLFLEPSRRNDETLYAARKRVLRAVFTDPLVWLFVLIAIYIAISCFNGTIELFYDFVDSKWGLSTPLASCLPSAAQNAGYAALALTLAVMVTVASCRHALGRSARLMYPFLVSFFAGIAAISAVLMTYFGNERIKSLTLCSLDNASFAGSAFGLFFAAGLVALSGIYERRWNKALMLFSFAVGSTFTGLVYFAPPSVIVFYSSIAAIAILFSLVYIAVTQSVNAAFKYVAALIMAAVIPLLALIFIADDSLRALKSPALDGTFFETAYSAARLSHAQICSAHWSSGNIWLGSGFGSFPLVMQFSLPQDAWVSWSCNGWWQALAEGGIIGVALLTIPYLIMAYTLLSRMFAASVRKSFLPLCLLGILAPAAVIAEGFFNASFMRLELWVGASALFALGASSFPLPRKPANGDKK